LEQAALVAQQGQEQMAAVMMAQREMNQVLERLL